MKELLYIQGELKAPKNQRNTFGNYNYRSCEDILEAVKPLLQSTETVLTVSDEVVQVGDRIYVKATATLKKLDGTVLESVSAFAREDETQKGMSVSQITGSASSYARKYALNGLFLIDDVKDADATNKHEKEVKDHKAPLKKDLAASEDPFANMATNNNMMVLCPNTNTEVSPKYCNHTCKKREGCPMYS